jgi:hypothetical protein
VDGTFQVTIYFFVGKPRMGKGLHMTMNAYHDAMNGRKIFSNYDLKNFPNNNSYTKLKDVNDTLHIQELEMEQSPKDILLQEADKWFDARRSGKISNVLLSVLTGQAGKRNIDIMYDSQFPTRIDKGLRDVTDYTISCVCHYENPVTKKNPLYFHYTWYEGYMGFPKPLPIKQYPMPAIFMEQFYKLYDTYQPTKSAYTSDKV